MIRLSFALAVGLLAAAAPASQAIAHHAFQGEFDGDAPVTLVGKVSAVEWTNPHSLILLTVATDGKTPRDWAVVTGTPEILRGKGICRETLKAGDAVTIRAYQTRDKSCASAKGYAAQADGPSVHPGACKAGGGALTLASGRSVTLGYGSETTAPWVVKPATGDTPADGENPCAG